MNTPRYDGKLESALDSGAHPLVAFGIFRRAVESSVSVNRELVARLYHSLVGLCNGEYTPAPLAFIDDYLSR